MFGDLECLRWEEHTSPTWKGIFPQLSPHTYKETGSTKPQTIKKKNAQEENIPLYEGPGRIFLKHKNFPLGNNNAF